MLRVPERVPLPSPFRLESVIRCHGIPAWDARGERLTVETARLPWSYAARTRYVWYNSYGALEPREYAVNVEVSRDS
jgi:hypothetical protein